MPLRSPGQRLAPPVSSCSPSPTVPDNIGVYIPAFSRSTLSQLGVTFLLFALLCLIWWLLAERFAAYPLLRRKLQQYQHILVPLVLIAIGLSVLLG